MVLGWFWGGGLRCWMGGCVEVVDVRSRIVKSIVVR